ncbi:MAG: penicillin-binding protein 2 [bacterium]
MYYSSFDFQKKYLLFIIIIISLIGLLLARSFYLQIIKGSLFSSLSDKNKIRKLITRTKRGDIFDKNNTLLAGSIPSLTVSFFPWDLKQKEREKTTENLCNLFKLDIQKIKQKIENTPRYKDIKIKKDVNIEVVSLIEENKVDFPEVKIVIEPNRKYIYKEIFCHLLGYVDEISSQEYEKLKDSTYNYEIGDYIGKMGLEKTYEKFLHGENGYELAIINAYGNKVKNWGNSGGIKKLVEGNSLTLTVDLNLQKIAYECLQNKTGTIIAINPQNGSILSLVSSPSFDPNIFLDVITQDDFNKIFNNSKFPLLNRSIQGRYPPGSVFKIVTTLAALEENIKWNNFIPCTGEYKKGKWVYRCWEGQGHGYSDITKAFAFSCNVFFYQLGEKLGASKIVQYAKTMELDTLTNIDLPGEIKGFIPSPSWKKKVKKTNWYLGDTLHLAIGQSNLAITPLRIVMMVSAIANNGTFYKPYLVKKIKNAEGKEFFITPKIVKKMFLEPEKLNEFKKILFSCVQYGTGWKANIKDAMVFGKTGTAQVRKSKKRHEYQLEKFRDHAWFTGWAEKNGKKIAVVVFVEHGGSGGEAAAPLAQKIFNAYFNSSLKLEEKKLENVPSTLE